MQTMNAMMLERIHDLRQTSTPLTHQLVPIPTPGPEEILIRVAACGVCHTELDEIEGRTPPPNFPVILRSWGGWNRRGRLQIDSLWGHGLAWPGSTMLVADATIAETAWKIYALSLPLPGGMPMVGMLNT